MEKEDDELPRTGTPLCGLGGTGMVFRTYDELWGCPREEDDDGTRDSPPLKFIRREKKMFELTQHSSVASPAEEQIVMIFEQN